MCVSMFLYVFFFGVCVCPYFVCVCVCLQAGSSLISFRTHPCVKERRLGKAVVKALAAIDVTLAFSSTHRGRRSENTGHRSKAGAWALTHTENCTSHQSLSWTVPS